MEVAELFEISSLGGVVVEPSPEMPEEGFKPLTCSAMLEFPDGSEKTCDLKLIPAHFKLVDGGNLWKVVVTIDGMGKSEIPAGTRVMVDPSVAREVLG